MDPRGSAAQINDYGEWLLLFCSINGFCIENTYFAHKNIHKMWRLPNDFTKNETDYICVSK